MYKLAFLLTGVAVAGLAAATIWRGDKEASSERSERSERAAGASELARLNAEVALLRGQVGALSGSQDRMAERVSEQLAAQSEPAVRGPARDEHDQAEAQQAAWDHADAQLALLDETLAQEPIDREWAGWAETELTRAYGELDGATAMDIRCTATICRLDLEFATMEAQERSLDRLPGMAPWQGQGFFRMDRDARTMVVYLARDGQELPRLS